jgi:hypothetical protein
MTSMYCWYEPYKTALLETDRTKMRKRIQTAEAKIRDRQRVLAEDHGGTPEERQAMADAINGLKVLLKESAEWPGLHVPDGGPTRSD